MKSPVPCNPFDEAMRLGTVTEAMPTAVVANMPFAARQSAEVYHGSRLGKGEVGEFVVIRREDVAILGRISRVHLPERERLSVEPTMERDRSTNPVGRVELLTDIRLDSGEITGGVAVPPRIGAPLYSAAARLVQWIVEGHQRTGPTAVRLTLGTLAAASPLPVTLPPERLLGRHCAIIGVTGGGKSWTVAHLIEEAAKHRSKIVLIDPTGEFYRLSDGVTHLSLGALDRPNGTIQVHFPHRYLEENDLFALLTPSGQLQGPRLRDAIRSLKLAAMLGADHDLVDECGCIPKANKPKQPYRDACQEHARAIEAPYAHFDIAKLSQQIHHECVFPSADYGRDQSRWGDASQNDLSHCIGLIVRIEGILGGTEFGPVLFAPDTACVMERLETFMADASQRVCRISMKHVPFTREARAVVANAIARCLLAHARADRFMTQPMVVVLDEAHQFLSRKLNEEGAAFPLDAFERIAKEGRKYGLLVCLATQRPRDIPEGVLSQVGTMIVHRLGHAADRDVVERASRDIERGAAAFLPTLAPGQAVLIGAEFPIPVALQIAHPVAEPDSSGANFQRDWAVPPNAARL